MTILGALTIGIITLAAIAIATFIYQKLSQALENLDNLTDVWTDDDDD